MSSPIAVLAPSADALALSGITAGYGRTTILRDVDIAVPRGSVVALMGPNGAGKTTLLRVAAGALRPSAGLVLIDNDEVTHRAPEDRARAGLCMVPEGRGIFPNLSVRENLLMQVPPWVRDRSFDRALEAFPVLRARLGQLAGTMSGGEQQMLAIARCFLARPRIVLLDEVSMGLAPQVVDEIFAALRRLIADDVAVLLVEQYVARALDIATNVYLLDRGRVSFAGDPADLDEAELTRRYLGGATPPQ